jgi:ubiquinone/menaquinone biosynthesis C-methylase UbiE
MSDSIKFDSKKLAKLNNPERFKTLNPNKIWDALNLQNPQILVDIGAGTGFFATAFSSKLPNGKIYACDNSDVMIQWMKENITNKNIIPFQSSENNVNFPDGIADLVYMMNVHHELLEPKKILTESYRLLKAGGKIAIIDWKTEDMEQGPPLNIRIPDKEIFEQLSNVGFDNIINHKILPLHSFVTGQK